MLRSILRKIDLKIVLFQATKKVKDVRRKHVSGHANPAYIGLGMNPEAMIKYIPNGGSLGTNMKGMITRRRTR